MTFREHPPRNESATSITPAEVRAALESGQFPLRIRKEVSLPEGERMYAEWSADVAGAGHMPYSAALSLIDAKTKETNALFRAAVNESTDGTPVWDIVHRIVPLEKRGHGLGSFGITKLEEFAQALNATNDTLPLTLEIDSVYPTVVDFGLANGYEFVYPKEEEEYKRYQAELKEHKDTEDWKERGTLPSFQVMKVSFADSVEKDRAYVLIDRAKLAAYQSPPGAAKEFTITDDYSRTHEYQKLSEFKVITTSLGRTLRVYPLPFFVKVAVRKTLPALKEA